MAILGENLVEIMHCSVLSIVGVNWLAPWKFRVSWVDRKPWIIDFLEYLAKVSLETELFFDTGKYKIGNRHIISAVVTVQSKFDTYGRYGIF